MSPLVVSLFAILVAVAADAVRPVRPPVVRAAPGSQASAHASAEASGTVSGSGQAHADASAHAHGGNAHAEAHAVVNSRRAYSSIPLHPRYEKCSSVIDGFVSDRISNLPNVQIPPRQNGTALIYGDDCQTSLGWHKIGLQVTVCDQGDRKTPVLVSHYNDEVVVASSSPTGFIVFSRQFCGRGDQ